MSAAKVMGGSLGAIVSLFVAQILAQLIKSLFVQIYVPESICNIISGILYLFFAYFLLKLFAKKILKIDLESLGMPKFRIDTKWFIVAVSLPIIVTAIYMLFPGEFVHSNMNGMQMFATLGAGIFFSGIAAGFVEEMVFRGFVMNLFYMKWNRTIAVIVPSVLFGAAHLIGTDFSLLGIILLLVAGTLVGIMFSFIALENHSVWNSGIVHCLWNIIIGGGVLKVSDHPNDYSILTYVLDSKHFAITGGEFGIESSLISIPVYTLVILLTLMMMKRKSVEKI